MDRMRETLDMYPCPSFMNGPKGTFFMHGGYTLPSLAGRLQVSEYIQRAASGNWKDAVIISNEH